MLFITDEFRLEQDIERSHGAGQFVRRLGSSAREGKNGFGITTNKKEAKSVESLEPGIHTRIQKHPQLQNNIAHINRFDPNLPGTFPIFVSCGAGEIEAIVLISDLEL